ncbi:MAG TPA: ubiquinol oxidase subunit II [Patescibacteria group bacterium]|nr:ubiquinol oxidase subunit II [Patescibacteria group bacterium]
MKQISKKLKIILPILLVAATIITISLLLRGHNFQLLNPQGIIAHQERSTMFTAVLLMLTLAVPLLVATFVIAYKYRATNEQADYQPEWDHNLEWEFIRWGLPAAIVVLLGILTWNTSHAVDPYKKIDPGTKTLTIQVVALQWKWLFIYPGQNIATVNFVEFPQNTPVNFQLTADAPMSSFWIPQLGGQMYAMPGMVTQLNLMADSAGEYAGTAAEINGAGFAGMKFTAKSVSSDDFNSWLNSMQATSSELTLAGYNDLAKPSEYNPQAFFAPVEPNLYNEVIMKFMAPEAGQDADMPGMHM